MSERMIYFYWLILFRQSSTALFIMLINMNRSLFKQADWLLKSSWKTKQKVMGRLQCCAINRAKVSLLLTCNPDKSNPCFSKARGHSISLIQMKATKNTDTR